MEVMLLPEKNRRDSGGNSIAAPNAPICQSSNSKSSEASRQHWLEPLMPGALPENLPPVEGVFCPNQRGRSQEYWLAQIEFPNGKRIFLSLIGLRLAHRKDRLNS